jgi:ferritin-like metal-binding protein YciE
MKKQTPDATELLLDELKGIYSAESQLMRAAPRLAKVAETESLRKMLETRLEQGERIIEELDQAFETMNTSPGRRKNVAAEGLIGDAREHIQEVEAGPALDAVLAAAIQKTEHYCIAAWGTAKALAEATGQQQVVKTMERALEEGKKFDAEMTRLAESELTPALLSMSEGEEEEGEEGEATARSRKSRPSESHARH